MLEFGSFRGTVVVASVIPLGVIGGLVLLFLTGNTLSFTAMVGFVALVGIEIKNSILLVDFTNRLRARGLALDDAIAEAGEVRFLPILLTSLTAIGGLTPLAAQGSGLYSPLAIVIMGGLVSSTLLARLVTPVLYKLLEPEVHPEDAGEPLEHVAVLVRRGVVARGIAVAVLGGRIGTELEQLFHRLQVADSGGGHQRRRLMAPPGTGIHAGALFHERRDEVRKVGRNGDVNRRRTAVHAVQIRALVDQLLDVADRDPGFRAA